MGNNKMEVEQRRRHRREDDRSVYECTARVPRGVSQMAHIATHALLSLELG